MADIRTISPEKYNNLLAEALKKEDEFKTPDWTLLVKTSPHKKRPTQDPDFWYKRTASILRQIYIHEVVGVQRLRSRYGGRIDRGAKPDKFRKSGGKMIRSILQQLDSAGFTEKVKGKKSGRKLTTQGKKFLDDIGVEE
jgi:small subunit ribosomal protein S19e